MEGGAEAKPPIHLYAVLITHSHIGVNTPLSPGTSDPNDSPDEHPQQHFSIGLCLADDP